MFRQLVRTDLLILDDWGPDRLTAMQRRHLMEIVEDRYQTASIAITSQIAEFDAITKATAAYLWIVTEGNARAAQVAAGRAYMRMALEASARGLALHPNQQALQEYPEVAAHHAAIHELLDAPRPANTVQMLARLGYPSAGASEQPPAPRRGLEAHLTG
ncbi:MAG: ATP-binding protein [Rhodosalinus sp.]